VVDAPLHVVYLNSDLVKGAVMVGIRPTLPVGGISLILGNDLVGSKVMPTVAAAVLSDKGKTPSTNNDWVAPVSLKMSIGIFSLCSDAETKPLEIKGL